VTVLTIIIIDNNGNTATKVVGSNTTSYAWDFENRMSSVTLPGSGGTVSFKYDPFGRRIYKSSSSATSVFAYDGDNLVEETNSSGVAVARYSQTQNIDEPLAMLRSGATSYYHADGLGSVTSLSSAAGSIANTYTYDSYGKLTASTGSLVNPFQYTARELDPETNLYFYRARYYDQSAGRFVSEDPASFLSGGVNFYQYVENSPLGFKDPNGLQAQPAAPCCDEKKIKDGLRRLQQAFAGAAALKSKVFQEYQQCLQKLANDPDVKCGPPPKEYPRECGHHGAYSPSTIVITPNGSRGLGGCPGAMATAAHEMVHSCYQSGFGHPDLLPYDQEKEAYGITCQIWGIQCDCARNPRLCDPGL
jgi:RHS repeat-associated protein